MKRQSCETLQTLLTLSVTLMVTTDWDARRRDLRDGFVHTAVAAYSNKNIIHSCEWGTSTPIRMSGVCRSRLKENDAEKIVWHFGKYTSYSCWAEKIATPVTSLQPVSLARSGWPGRVHRPQIPHKAHYSAHYVIGIPTIYWGKQSLVFTRMV